MLRMACSMHLSQRALLRMPRRCTQRDLRTVRQRIMPYFPPTTIVKSTTGRNRALSMCLCNQLCKMQYQWPELLGNPPLVALPLSLFHLMRLPCGRHPPPMRMYGLMYGGGQSMLRR